MFITRPFFSEFHYQVKQPVLKNNIDVSSGDLVRWTESIP